MPRYIVLTSLVCLLLLIQTGVCDENSDEKPAEEMFRIELKDGTSLIGTIIEETDEYLKFRLTQGSEIEIKLTDIKRRDLLTGSIKDGKYVRIDPNYTRLLFTPTARSLKHGDNYFALYMIFFPFYAHGIADVVTLAGGITLFPGVDNQLFYLAPKLTFFESENLSTAAGALHLQPIGDDFDDEGAGVVYGLATYGEPELSATLGLGWGYAGEDFLNEPIVVLGGEWQINNSFKLLSENWFPPVDDGYMLSFGVRIFGDHFATDLGMFFTTFADDTFGLPWLSFAYNF